jgi:hypothetical protein
MQLLRRAQLLRYLIFLECAAPRDNHDSVTTTRGLLPCPALREVVDIPARSLIKACLVVNVATRSIVPWLYTPCVSMRTPSLLIWLGKGATDVWAAAVPSASFPGLSPETIRSEVKELESCHSTHRRERISMTLAS